jgi:hypothetical protein
MMFCSGGNISIALSSVRTTRNVKRREKGKGILIMLSCIFFSLLMVSISFPVLCGLFHNVWFDADVGPGAAASRKAVLHNSIHWLSMDDNTKQLHSAAIEAHIGPCTRGSI